VNVMARMPVAIAAARVDGIEHPAAAIQTLESIRADAERRGLPRLAFESRRAIVQLRSGPSRNVASVTSAEAESLRNDAKARGFGLYAR
jgi:hypothetical protein